MTPFRLLMRGEPLLERGVQRLRRDALGPGNDRNDCLIGFRMLFAHRVDELPYDAAIGAHLEQAPAGCFGDQRVAVRQALLGGARVALEEDLARALVAPDLSTGLRIALQRSEEHTSELQSLMRNSYAVFCLKT